jgi:uncharacterized membrane protein YoaK (UPF0700 family)
LSSGAWDRQLVLPLAGMMAIILAWSSHMAGEAHERRMVALLLILSMTTGLIDAVSVLGLGKVFTANMTGNIVFLGFAFAGIKGFAWSTYATALVAFVVGATVAARIGKAHQAASRRRWLLTIAWLEALLLWATAACAFAPAALPADLVMIALTAIAMGARNATVRQLKVADLTTTVLTLTITGLAADSPLGGGSNSNAVRRVLAVTALLAGAFAGAMLWKTAGVATPLGLAGAITLAATYSLADAEDRR